MQCGGIYSVVGHAKIPALRIDTGELFAGCEKLGLVCIFNGRGGQIRTDDPLLPKLKTLFLEKLDFGSLGESVEGKGFILFLKTALNEKISICAAAAHDSASVSYRFFLYALCVILGDPNKNPNWCRFE